MPADVKVMQEGREGQLPRLSSFGEPRSYSWSKVRAGSRSAFRPAIAECSALIGKSLYLCDTDGEAETNH